MITFPQAPAQYSQQGEQTFRGQLAAILNRCFTASGDVRIKSIRFTLTAEDGTEYSININDDGAIVTEPYP